ncbi:hypothetical protein [Sabulicella rubraurantiaca]|uniref:hypothetical protein n=1 Tax=Sabulicella rubraurantiaca TaxID=2811429 RepID=UPI001A95D77D|nr:hypothetical protein [Sabulicella rubraurantiaca]
MAGTFFGWRVVAVSFAVAFLSYGCAVYGPGVWLHALVLERGWSVAFVSACITLHFLAGAAVASRLPALHTRLGVATTTRLGLVVLAAGCAGWASACGVGR